MKAFRLFKGYPDMRQSVVGIIYAEDFHAAAIQIGSTIVLGQKRTQDDPFSELNEPPCSSFGEPTGAKWYLREESVITQRPEIMDMK